MHAQPFQAQLVQIGPLQLQIGLVLLGCLFEIVEGRMILYAMACSHAGPPISL